MHTNWCVLIEISMEIGMWNFWSVVNCLCNGTWNSLYGSLYFFQSDEQLIYSICVLDIWVSRPFFTQKNLNSHILAIWLLLRKTILFLIGLKKMWKFGIWNSFFVFFKVCSEQINKNNLILNFQAKIIKIVQSFHLAGLGGTEGILGVPERSCAINFCWVPDLSCARIFCCCLKRLNWKKRPRMAFRFPSRMSLKGQKISKDVFHYVTSPHKKLTKNCGNYLPNCQWWPLILNSTHQLGK